MFGVPYVKFWLVMALVSWVVAIGCTWWVVSAIRRLKPW